MTNVHWTGRQWRVDDDGLDTLDGTYPIEADRLGELRGDSNPPMADWLPQLSEKTWIDFPDFIEAFRRALTIHAGKYPSLPPGAWDEGMKEARRNLGR
jgi:hypothetical protein